MDNVSVIMFIIVGVSILVGSFYLIYSVIASEPVRKYNDGTISARIKEAKAGEIEDYKKLLVGESRATHTMIQKRIDKLRSELEEFGDERTQKVED